MLSGSTPNFFGADKLISAQFPNVDVRRLSLTNLESLKAQLSDKDSPLIAGAFDAKSIVPGMGIDSPSLPQAPSIEAYQNFITSQMQHLQTEQDKLNNLNLQINTKKEAIFSSKHFEFDQDKKIVLNTEGNPKLFEGGETQAQKQQRIAWESEMQQNLKVTHEKEYEEFQSSANSRLQAAYQDAFENPGDSIKSDAVKALLSQIEKEENELKFRQLKDEVTAGLEGLPDPDNPEQSLGQFAVNGLNEYKELHEQNLAAEAEDPDGQAVNQYFQSLQDFAFNQKIEISQANLGEDFDPDAMKNAIIELGSLNPEALQSEINQLGGFDPGSIQSQINPLNNLNPETAQNEINQLGGFNPEAAQNQINPLNNLNPEAAQSEINQLGGFDPEALQNQIATTGNLNEISPAEINQAGGYNPDAIQNEINQMTNLNPLASQNEISEEGEFNPDAMKNAIKNIKS